MLSVKRDDALDSVTLITSSHASFLASNACLSQRMS